MKTRIRVITLLLSAGIGLVHAEDWQVVLLKPRDCASCTFLEETLKRSGQIRQAVLEDGVGSQVTAPILRRNSSDLTGEEWTQLRALPWFDEPHWRQRAAARTAQVLLKRDGVVVSGGDITESADLSDARFPDDITMPFNGRDLTSVYNARSAYVTDLYLRSWNLSWFYRLALDPTLLRSRNGIGSSAAGRGPLLPPLAPANVMLMSTASGAADNEIFNALRTEEIRDVLLQSLALDLNQLHIFYGGGKASGNNALEVRGGRIGLVRRDVKDASPFSPEAATRIFQSIRAQPASRNLMVLIGHGDADGAGMWGSPAPLSPTRLRALHEHSGGDNVLVSGNCFGGVMARSTSCGFFGARPDIVATGCQADAAVVAQSKDYLHMFFSSLAPKALTAADADGNGAISFSEAHWYASTEADPRNITYTSIDALADAWYESHREALPRSLTVREILMLMPKAPPAEAQALRTLLAAQDANLALPLEDPVGAAARWRPGAPRALAIQLARRLLFLNGRETQSAEVARLQSCENRTIASFLKP